MGILKIAFELADSISTVLLVYFVFAICYNFVDELIIYYGNNIDNFSFYTFMTSYRFDFSRYTSIKNILLNVIPIKMY